MYTLHKGRKEKNKLKLCCITEIVNRKNEHFGCKGNF